MSVQVGPSTTQSQGLSQAAQEANRAAGRPPGLVTIVVACCGQLEYTRLCVPGLLRHSRNPYELIFLDCGSLDGTTEYLAGLAAGVAVRVEVVRVPADPGPAKGRGEDVIPIRGEFVALLNNDTVVTEGWLDRLVRVVSLDSGIGMVAPMSNYAAAPLLVDPVPYRLAVPPEAQAGDLSSRSNGAQAVAVERFAREWGEQHKGKWSEAEHLSGGGALLKREALQKVGQFPTRTALGAFNIEALGQRVRDAGYRLAVCGDCFIHSFGTRTPMRRGST